MKTKILLLLCVTFLTTQVFARRVYVHLYSDATAWSHITEDADNVIITLPEGSTNFVGNVLAQLLENDEVWVAKGEYVNTAKLTLLTNETLSYGGISLYGGFAGTESAVSERILTDTDGNGLTEAWEFLNETNFKGVGNNSENAVTWQLFQLSTNATVDGITFSDHYVSQANTAAGGVVEATASVRNCIIRDLTTSSTKNDRGGGLYVPGGQIENCLFETIAGIGTSDVAYGGALCIFGIADGETGTPAGYVKNSMIRNCKADGQATNKGRGGAIFGKSGVIIENCVIYNNIANGHSAAIYFHNGGDANKHVNRIINSTIVNNVSSYATFPECDYFEIYNTVIWGNPTSAGSYSNNIRFKSLNTSVKAYPYINGLAYHGTIQNTNAVKNTYTPIMLTGAIGDASSDTNNPKFKTPTTFQGVATNETQLEEIREANWMLLSGSPLINAGVNSPTNNLTGYDVASLLVSFSGTDIRGISRTTSFDVGAYEYQMSTGHNQTKDVPFVLYTEASKIIISNLKREAEISIFSLNGTQIYQSKTGNPDISVLLNDKGFYLVNIKMNNEQYSRKVVL